MEKSLGHADKLAKKVSSSQGGAYRNQGPKSTGGKGGKVGDAVSSPHTSHDDAMWSEGGAGRSVKSIR